jgi:hypothetical protein
MRATADRQIAHSTMGSDAPKRIENHRPNMDPAAGARADRYLFSAAISAGFTKIRR